MLRIIKWGSTAAEIAGVFLLAGRATEPSLAFAVMLLGSLGWVFTAWQMKEWSILLLNAAFTLSNLLGIWRWLYS